MEFETASFRKLLVVTKLALSILFFSNCHRNKVFPNDVTRSTTLIHCDLNRTDEKNKCQLGDKGFQFNAKALSVHVGEACRSEFKIFLSPGYIVNM